MQFYLDGYKPGDPDSAPADDHTRPAALPDVVDVLIVGSGPAGTVLAAQLSAFPAIRTRLVERRDGPLLLGQADGVACRTVEMFDAFGRYEFAAEFWSGKPRSIKKRYPEPASDKSDGK